MLSCNFPWVSSWVTSYFVVAVVAPEFEPSFMKTVSHGSGGHPEYRLMNAVELLGHRFPCLPSFGVLSLNLYGSLTSTSLHMITSGSVVHWKYLFVDLNAIKTSKQSNNQSRWCKRFSEKFLELHCCLNSLRFLGFFCQAGASHAGIHCSPNAPEKRAKTSI